MEQCLTLISTVHLAIIIRGQHLAHCNTLRTYISLYKIKIHRCNASVFQMKCSLSLSIREHNDDSHRRDHFPSLIYKGNLQALSQEDISTDKRKELVSEKRPFPRPKSERTDDTIRDKQSSASLSKATVKFSRNYLIWFDQIENKTEPCIYSESITHGILFSMIFPSYHSRKSTMKRCYILAYLVKKHQCFICSRIIY